MRTIKGQDLVRNEDNLPDGGLVNETINQQGTPVVEEIYGDIHSNIYKVLRDAGVTPNEIQDNEQNGYQFLKALKLLANELNDIEQVLTVDGFVVEINIKLSSLPDEYLFIGKITENLSPGDYALKGSEPNALLLTVEDNIISSSVVLLKINQNGCTIKSISRQEVDFLNVSFGNPLSYNSSSMMYYYNEGNVFTDYPENYSLQDLINVYEGNLENKVVQVILFKNRFFCLTCSTQDDQYNIYSINLNDLTVVENKNISLQNVSDNLPHMYCNGISIILSNSSLGGSNNSVNDSDLAFLSFNENLNTLSILNYEQLDSRFKKTTNLVALKDSFLVYTQGNLFTYPFDGADRSFLGNFKTVNGMIFSFNNSNYHSNGEIATKWQY
jgi:hypothetical protein